MNFTPIPTSLITAMPKLTDAELRTLLTLSRLTVGRGLERHRVTMQEIADLGGLNRRSVLRGLDRAEKKGLVEITRTQGRTAHTYRLITQE